MPRFLIRITSFLLIPSLMAGLVTPLVIGPTPSLALNPLTQIMTVEAFASRPMFSGALERSMRFLRQLKAQVNLQGIKGIAVPQKKSPRGVYIFDVDGTLAETGKPLSSEMIEEIIALLREGARVVLTTGQDLDSEQQKRLVTPFPHELRENLLIYANEGAVKYIRFRRLA